LISFLKAIGFGFTPFGAQANPSLAIKRSFSHWRALKSQFRISISYNSL